MKKINMIVGKKQIVLAALVVILGVAVYLNWEFAKNDGQFDITAGTTSDKNYGMPHWSTKQMIILHKRI